MPCGFSGLCAIARMNTSCARSSARSWSHTLRYRNRTTDENIVWYRCSSSVIGSRVSGVLRKRTNEPPGPLLTRPAGPRVPGVPATSRRHNPACRVSSLDGLGQRWQRSGLAVPPVGALPAVQGAGDAVLTQVATGRDHLRFQRVVPLAHHLAQVGGLPGANQQVLARPGRVAHDLDLQVPTTGRPRVWSDVWQDASAHGLWLRTVRDRLASCGGATPAPPAAPAR